MIQQSRNSRIVKKYLSALQLLSFVFFVFTIASTNVNAQSGMTYNEFKKKLEVYFAEDLISDIKKQLPQGSDFAVWGWDAGDFSGDGVVDIAFAVKIRAEKQKILHVYQFVDVDGFMTKVGQFDFDYFELPLEIGIFVKNNTCYITSKKRQYDWRVKGYKFDNGSLLLLDDFATERIEDYTHESYRNYQSLQNSEKYLITSNNKEEFYSSYLTIPSYSRGRVVFKGFTDAAQCNYVEYVCKGAYYWKGENDLSYSVNSAYDDNYLYMTIRIHDDEVVGNKNDSCASDYVELWLDITPAQKQEQRFKMKETIKKYKNPTIGDGIYSFKFFPGDFLEKRAFIKELSTTDTLDEEQNEAIKSIKVVSSLTNYGYDLKFKIPFTLFGFVGPPIDKQNIAELGCTVVVHDLDNQFRPEEETVMATSAFDSHNPNTFGTLLLIPQSVWYGEANNIFKEDILKSILDYGF